MHKPIDRPSGAEQLLKLGRGPGEATLNLQRDLLEAYAQSGRACVARAHKEMELWSHLAANVAASRSIPEAVGAYQECAAQRMQMALDDGLRFYQDYQGLVARFTRALSSNWNLERTAAQASPAKRRA
jgi:hypothetical protein